MNIRAQTHFLWCLSGTGQTVAPLDVLGCFARRRRQWRQSTDMYKSSPFANSCVFSANCQLCQATMMMSLWNFFSFQSKGFPESILSRRGEGGGQRCCIFFYFLNFNICLDVIGSWDQREAAPMFVNLTFCNVSLWTSAKKIRRSLLHEKKKNYPPPPLSFPK